MKHMKRDNVYKASNVTFDPTTMQAHSYRWWKFLDRINGKVVFNNYSYSSATSGHQRKVESTLDRLGMKIDIYVECPRGLQDLQSGIDYYAYEIKKLSELINNPRTQAKKNNERFEQIQSYQDKVKALESLIGKAAKAA